MGGPTLRLVTAPGWYPEPGQPSLERYWTGTQWTPQTRPATVPQHGPQPLPVQPDVRQAHDRAQYNRQQTGHSILKHIFLGGFVLWIPTIYYAISPNHYFHL